MDAALNRSNEALDVLLLAGANPNKVASNGDTALFYALQSKDMQVIDKLCVLTTVGRKKAFYMIACRRLNISEPLLQFIRDSLTTGKYIVRKLICLSFKINKLIIIKIYVKKIIIK